MNAPIVLRPVQVDGWPLAFAGEEEQARVRDLDLGERLGYDRPRDIRKLIDRLAKEAKLPGIHVRATVARTSMPRGGMREVQVDEYWLTLPQALKVAAKSETEPADAILNEMIRVFTLALQGRLPGQLAPSVSAQALTPRVADLQSFVHFEIDRIHTRLDCIGRDAADVWQALAAFEAKHRLPPALPAAPVAIGTLFPGPPPPVELGTAARSVGVFLAERCEIDPAARVSRHNLRIAYEAWTKANGVRAMGARHLCGALRFLGYYDVKVRKGTQRGQVEDGWRGIGLRPHSVETPPATNDDGGSSSAS